MLCLHYDMVFRNNTVRSLCKQIGIFPAGHTRQTNRGMPTFAQYVSLFERLLVRSYNHCLLWWYCLPLSPIRWRLSRKDNFSYFRPNSIIGASPQYMVWIVHHKNIQNLCSPVQRLFSIIGFMIYQSFGKHEHCKKLRESEGSQTPFHSAPALMLSDMQKKRI